jgi:hypothetical protein
MPAMKEYLIRHSTEATGRDKSWDEATYKSIDWRQSTMAKYSKNYRTGDASRFQSTPMTYYPPNNALQLSTTAWMDADLPLIACGRHSPYVNLYL